MMASRNPAAPPMADESGGRRLRVAIVIPGFVVDRDDPGLPAVVDLVERIGRRHDCQVIALRHPPARPAYRVAGATVTALGAGAAAGAVGRAAVLAIGIRAVLRLHRRRRLDLIHGLWADEAGAVATIAARLVRRPAVVSVLGGELARLPEIGYGAALGRGGRWTVAVSFRGADLVTAGSSTALSPVLERRPTATVALLPLGVDTTVFRPAELPGPPAAQTILFAGSLEPVKDPATMLRVFGRLAAGRPGLSLELVGDGRLRAGLEASVAGTVLAERVRFSGHIARNEMPGRYRSATVLAITSRHEGQSMVAVEAAASGLPVVGGRVGILPDLGDAALIVPVGDEAALADALAAVLDDPVRAARMAAAGRATAVARFDLGGTAADLLRRYDELVTRGGGGVVRP
jgi:glycosyltransferase involved in cell wall biosynthesis